MCCGEKAEACPPEDAFPADWAGTIRKLALARKDAGEHRRAIYLLEEVTRSQPGNALAIYNLAALLALAGEGERSLQELSLALAGQPECRSWAAKHEGFASLRGDERFRKLLEGS